MSDKKMIADPERSEQPEQLDDRKADEVAALRQALSDGSFGTVDMAAQSGAAAEDAVIDGDAVKRFLSMFGAKGDTPLKGYDWKAYLPSSMDTPSFWGPIFGIVREETESIYIFDSKTYETEEYIIGYIDNGSYMAEKAFHAFCSDAKPRIIGGFEHGHLTLKISALQTDASVQAMNTMYDVRIKPYDTVTNLFSRNTGLLESSAMLDKCVVLVGCGSVGSFAAMELARSGVGKFVLCDTDTLEIHNICRHQCGFEDLGRYKVDAVKDKILNINPNAQVITYRSVIQRAPADELRAMLGRNTLIMGGGDNRASSDWACKLAIETDSTFVSTGCWTRAFAGEIFYWASGQNLSCYSCALGALIDDERPESHATYFGSDEEKDSLDFEPGIAVDIDFVTIIAIKIALDLLNRDNGQYTPRVIHHLKQYTWVCNTNSPNIGGERAEMFPAPLWITNNLKVNKDHDCPYCGGRD